MKTIIPPVDKQLLLAELNQDRFLRKANNGPNEIYLLNDKNSPNVLREIGRLREVTFRDAGGGTGKEVDLDEYDIGPYAFEQMIVWDPTEQEIVGGYRYVHCKNLLIDDDGKVHSPTASLFKYSPKFIKEYFPYTIELGRSFVQPYYQPTFNLRRGMYALDNLWDGIGALLIENQDVNYLFGKVTMYPEYDRLARDLILYFMRTNFPDPDRLIYPHEELKLTTEEKILASIFTGCNYDENYRILIQKVRKLGENVPPLVNAYMSLSSTMKSFGTAVNYHFGDVEETGILLTVADMFPVKIDRHITTYKKQ